MSGCTVAGYCGAKSFDSPYYPCEKVQNYNAMAGAEEIPLLILRYLMDLPDKHGYQPRDDNERPRVRLLKYLFHDEANPLSRPLPTPEEKLALLFDGTQPDINTNERRARHPKGYRLYPQAFWGQSQLEARTELRCYIGRVDPTGPYRANIALVFDIVTNVNLESNTGTDALSRSFAMEAALIDALNGVNIAGVGTVVFDRFSDGECGSRMVYDEGNNVGRRVTMSIAWMGSGGNHC